MSDQYEETVRIVRALELRHSIDEMRAVRIEDGRNTIHEIQMRDQFGEWGTLSTGLARRRKGDRRDPVLGGALSLYRALANLTERHREAFAQQWPGHFPKQPAEVGQARAAMREAHAQIDRAVEQIRTAENSTYRANLMEERITKALELLEASPEAWLGGSNDLAAAAHVLRGGEAKEKNPSNDRGARALKILEEGPRVVGDGVVEAWSLVAQRALAVLRGETNGEE
ncbi:hypothetical protein [Streptomyces mirabilis]|uniref:hypothetical protein n=1 Tax=Streptomyces mirabilis TaxID=68239 RepID=UPI0036C3FB8B